MKLVPPLTSAPRAQLDTPLMIPPLRLSKDFSNLDIYKNAVDKK
jgi:hypothetical protein